MDNNPGIRIPSGQLAPATLRSVIEEFVTRDGTNLADADTKIEQVKVALERGTVEIWFNAETRTCSIVPCDA